MLNIRKKEVYTIPNLFSFYRLISFPLVLYFILTLNQRVFVSLLVFNLITDILDGWIARKFHLQTDFGAKLDSLADEGTYILGLLGIYFFKQTELQPYFTGILIFAISYVLTWIVSLIRFRVMPSLHLYSSKAGAYMQGIFFFLLFTYGFLPWFFYITLFWGMASFWEQIVVMLIIPKMSSSLKGLYWICKKQPNGF